MRGHRWGSFIAEVDVAGALANTTYDRERSPARKHRTVRLFCRIDVSALLAIFIVLICVFLPTGAHDIKGPNCDLAKVDNPVWMQRADREDAVVIAVNKDGTLYFGRDKLRSPEVIAARIVEAVRTGSPREVYIRADYRVKYGAVMDVVDQVRASKVERIGFLVEQRRRPRAAGP